jgi:hypothetical protein
MSSFDTSVRRVTCNLLSTDYPMPLLHCLLLFNRTVRQCILCGSRWRQRYWRLWNGDRTSLPNNILGSYKRSLRV